jgi:predicted nucleotidyltransferase
MSGAIDLIFGTSEVRRQILAAFYAGPGLVTHARELARRLGHPSQVVGRELRRLEDAGILASETVGRARRYRVNVDSPIAADVRGLVLRTIGAEALIRNALGGVAGIEEAWIFGSHARGTERPCSDIDLLVIGPVDRGALSERLVEAEQELGRDVNMVAYTRAELADLESAGDPFVIDVMAGPRTRVDVIETR